MKDTDYAFCVARIRANEKKLLDSSFMNKLASCGSFESAVGMLSDIGWCESSTSVRDIINMQNKKLWSLISDSVPDKKEADCLCVLNDFFNIKCAVKCAFTGEDPAGYFIYPSSLDTDELKKVILTKKFSSFGKTEFALCAKEAYELACKTENGQNAEIVIDCATLEALAHYSEFRKNSLFSEICDFFVDTANIKTAFRCISAGKNADFVRNAITECRHISRSTLCSCVAEGDEALMTYLARTRYLEGAQLYGNGPVLFDKWCDESIIRLVSKAKYTAFGFDPVCAYYYTRLNEIKNVRIILTALQSGISADKITERLRCPNV